MLCPCVSGFRAHVLRQENGGPGAASGPFSADLGAPGFRRLRAYGPATPCPARQQELRERCLELSSLLDKSTAQVSCSQSCCLHVYADRHAAIHAGICAFSGVRDAVHGGSAGISGDISPNVHVGDAHTPKAVPGQQYRDLRNADAWIMMMMTGTAPSVSG
eukprot:1137840-Rhodomonas_salina.2